MKYILLMLVVFVMPIQAAENDLLERVAPENVHENTLLDKTYSFSVSSPDSSWVWFKSKRHVYDVDYLIVKQNEPYFYMVQVSDKKFAPLNFENVKKYMSGVRNQINESGNIVNFKSIKSDDVLMNSYYLTYQLKLNDGTTFFINQYLYVQGRLYVFTRQSIEQQGNSTEFDAIVSSFKHK